MSAIVYLMRNEENPSVVKLGYRTKNSFREVVDETERAFPGFSCFVLYNLHTDNSLDTEAVVKRIHTIFRLMAGRLEGDSPEDYRLCPDKAAEALTAIADLRDNRQNLLIVDR